VGQNRGSKIGEVLLPRQLFVLKGCIVQRVFVLCDLHACLLFSSTGC
jgi:hypothetical protein